ncbi:MAG: F0F1 ATP synthase subunit B [Alphaproteobacteria bacterium]|nr:F0F1 ATP synthase subunit B [Alphaproteobacteria bacterium]
MMLESAEFWVAVAFITFVASVFKLGRKAILGALDRRAMKIQSEIDEATRLREEAQAVLAAYQRKQREAAEETEEMLEYAKEEAELLRRRTLSELEEALGRRQQQALDHIAQAEAEATQEVRNRAVDIAVAATMRILEENLDTKRGNDLIKAAIEELPKKLH